MDNKIAFLAPLAVILISAFFIFSSSNGTPIVKQFSVNLISPTPYKNLTTPKPSTSYISPTTGPTQVPSSTPTINLKSTLPFTKIYTAQQIEFFRAHNIYQLISPVKFPPLPKATDTQIPVYMINCESTSAEPWFKLSATIDWIPRQADVIKQTMHLFASKAYGSYPTAKEISDYQRRSGLTFKNQTGGVNAVALDAHGILNVNYYDSIQSYGGGSTRLECMGLSSLLTAMQYPSVKGIKQCVDEMPTGPDSCPYDFQP